MDLKNYHLTTQANVHHRCYCFVKTWYMKFYQVLLFISGMHLYLYDAGSK